MKRWASYAASKFAAAGCVYILFLIVPTGLDLYAMSEMTRELPLWPIFYGYAVLFAIAADFLLFQLRNHAAKHAVTIVLYAAGGYALFFAGTGEVNMINVIAGTIGACCSLAFCGLAAFFRGRSYNMATAAGTLVVLLLISWSDFTTIKGLDETYTSTSYEAKFTSFRGHKQLDVDLRQGQLLVFRVEWSGKNAGGHGLYVRGPNGRRMGMTSSEDGSYGVHASSDGQYRIVLTGNSISGSVRVNWDIHH